MKDNTKDAFLTLVRAGLWADANLNTDLNPTDNVDWEKIYQLAEEQSSIGVVLAGIERSKVKPPQELLLQWIGEVQMLEQQNKAMNVFIAELIEKLRKVDIYMLLVKGQGIAQCYERSLWRACGDVDFFLNEDNYNKAKSYLQPLASSIEPEGIYKKEYCLTIDSWTVELHGNMRCGLSLRIDKVLDEIKNDVFYNGTVRSWMNGETQVFIPGVNCDVLFIFTHFLKHFYCGGVGLKQVCDWCRLLWRYSSVLNLRVLESRIKQMGLMTEWKALGAFAVEYMGMPVEAMPFYSNDKKWKKKADKICAFILEVGNMGHNRDMSHFSKYPYLIRKCVSMSRRIGDLINHARIFPLDSLRFFPRIMFNGVRSAMRGE